MNSHRWRGKGFAVVCSLSLLALALLVEGGTGTVDHSLASAPDSGYTTGGANALGFPGAESTLQDADEATENEGAAQLDAQVGADGHMVGKAVPAGPERSDLGWILPAIVVLVGVAVSVAAIRLIFMPGDRIPRIGGGPNSNS